MDAVWQFCNRVDLEFGYAGGELPDAYETEGFPSWDLHADVATLFELQTAVFQYICCVESGHQMAMTIVYTLLRVSPRNSGVFLGHHSLSLCIDVSSACHSARLVLIISHLDLLPKCLSRHISGHTVAPQSEIPDKERRHKRPYPNQNHSLCSTLCPRPPLTIGEEGLPLKVNLQSKS